MFLLERLDITGRHGHTPECTEFKVILSPYRVPVRYGKRNFKICRKEARKKFIILE